MKANFAILAPGRYRIGIVPEPGTRIVGDPKGDAWAVAFDCQDIGQAHPTTIYCKPRKEKP